MRILNESDLLLYAMPPATQSVDQQQQLDLKQGWIWMKEDTSVDASEPPNAINEQDPIKSYKKRWFLLRGQFLFYFKHKSNVKRSPPLGVWLLLDDSSSVSFVPSNTNDGHDRLALTDTDGNSLNLLMPNKDDNYLNSWYRVLIACTRTRSALTRLHNRNSQQRQMIQDLTSHLQVTLKMVPPAPDEVLNVPSLENDQVIRNEDQQQSIPEAERLQKSLKGLVAQMKTMFNLQESADDMPSRRFNSIGSFDTQSITSTVRLIFSSYD